MQGPGRRIMVIGVRHLVLFMLFLASSVVNGDRAIMSIVGSMISKSLGLSHIAMGYIFSASAASYLVMQVPGGLLLDRYGARWIYTGAMTFCAIFTMAQGGVSFLHGSAAIVVLLVIRSLFGVAATPCVPANARLTATWFPAPERGFATAIFNSAQYFALLVFGPLIGWIAHTFSWPWTFFTLGATGFAVALAFPFVVRSPLRHPLMRREELDYIERHGALIHIETARRMRGFPWRDLRQIAFHRRLLGLYLYQYCIGVLMSFFLSWFPIYLVEQQGMSVLQAGVVTAVTALSGLLGNVTGGLLSDSLLKRSGSLTRARRIPILLGMLLALSILVCDFATSRIVVIVIMSVVLFGKGLAAMGWTMISDVSPKDLIGATGGLFNMVSNIAGVLTPIVIGYIVASSHSFNWALVFVAAHCLIGIFAFLVVMGRVERIELSAAGS
jgi:MFS transporter, ACS family, glucarate transporter